MNPTINFLFDEVAQYILLVNGFISIIVNIVAVHIILKRSSKHMIEYKWMLLHVTLASAFTDLYISILITPIPIENGVGTVMKGVLGRLFPTQGKTFCIILAVSVGYMIWANLLCFLYRLYLLTTVQYKWMHKYIFLIMCISLLSIVVSVLIYIPALASEKEIRIYAREKLDLVSNDTALWLILPKNFDANTTWGIYCLSYIIITYVIFGIITIIITRILSRIGNLSKGSVAYHKMLLRSLIMQTAVPFATVVFPILITGIAQKLKQNPATAPYARLCSVPGLILLSNYSISHVVVMLFYTTPYQKFVARTMRKYSCTSMVEKSPFNNSCRGVPIRSRLITDRENINDVML